MLTSVRSCVPLMRGHTKRTVINQRALCSLWCTYSLSSIISRRYGNACMRKRSLSTTWRRAPSGFDKFANSTSRNMTPPRVRAKSRSCGDRCSKSVIDVCVCSCPVMAVACSWKSLLKILVYWEHRHKRTRIQTFLASA